MTKRFKKLTYIIGGGLIAAGTLVACGHSIHHAPPEKKAEYIVEEINDELNLQDAQLTKLNALKDHMLQLHKEHKVKKLQTHEELRALLDKPYLDQEAILSHIKAKTSYINEEAQQVVALLGDFYNSLDDAQREEIREHVDKFMKRHKRWRGE